MTSSTVDIVFKPFVKEKTKKKEHPWEKPFLALIVGTIHSGKSSLILNMVQEMDKHIDFDRAYFFGAHLLDENLKFLNDRVFEKSNDPEVFHDTIQKLKNSQKKLKDEGKPLKKFLIILDDLTLDSAFLPLHSKGSAFYSVLLSLRHLNISIIITSHQYTMLPPVIRKNASFIFLFKLSPSDIEQIIEDSKFNKQKFLRAYEEATREPYNFLYISNKTHQLIKNFDQVL